ncbi:e3 ubiquitin-protein ligase ari8 [Hordeum vulgare]|nr:e3 ubiquitin-protein ligase ari8 [Hordeum vulgare]
MCFYKPSDPWVVQEFYCTTHWNLWRILLDSQQEWPVEDKDTGLDAETPPFEGLLALAENIEGPAPLPEEPRSPLLSLMLVEVSYIAPDNKKKETSGGLCSRGPQNTKSRDTHASSTHKGRDAENEEEKHYLQVRKREAPKGARRGYLLGFRRDHARARSPFLALARTPMMISNL